MPDVANLEPWMGWAKATNSPVLYLGIGTGRIAVPMVRAGIQLVGVDSHPGMLRRLRERLPDIELIQSRIEDLDLDRRFSLVMVPSSILNTTARLQRAALHMAAGGQLAFELMNPHWLKATIHPAVRVKAMTPAQVDMEVDYRLPDGSIQTQQARGPIIWPEDVEAWLKTVGLRLERMFGSDTSDLEASATYYVLGVRRPGVPNPQASP